MKNKKPARDTLWTGNFTRITAASALGAIGGIASSFALSFLVFDETGSTLASALVIAIQLIPSMLLPVIIAPLMDRFPRKPFLVGGDIVNSLLYALAGLYLHRFAFSYTGYLAFSLLLSCLSSFDELAYNSFYPKLLPPGREEKAYTVSAMLYPVLKVLMMPVSAVLFEKIGVANLLLLQAVLSLLAALVESGIKVQEETRACGERLSLRLWWNDIRETAAYLKHEGGLRSIYSYMAMTNGAAMGYSPLLVAFFRTAPGFTTAMYSLFSVAEFAGRTLGGILRYRYTVPEKRRFAFIFCVYQTYEAMDMCLLWLPYPLMLVNRAVCGFLGINSATIRQAAVQQYIPDHLRARVNACESMLITVMGGILSPLIGALGEIMDYRLCMTVCGTATLLVCWLTIFRNRVQVRTVLSYKEQK
ncbi:MAG: MFS transporter [Oscillospiraceae bacterium]